MNDINPQDAINYLVLCINEYVKVIEQANPALAVGTAKYADACIQAILIMANQKLALTEQETIEPTKGETK